jgi:hypothetical protein
VQLRQAREAREGLSKVVSDLNDLITNALPALYKALSDNKVTPRPLKPIAAVPVSPSA